MHLKIGISEWEFDEKKGKSVVERLAKAGIRGQLIAVKEWRNSSEYSSIDQKGTARVTSHAFSEALMKGKVDVVICSASYLPEFSENSLEVIAYLKREDPREVLLAMTEEIDFDNFARPWKIATDSELRKAWIRHYFSHLEIVESPSQPEIADQLKAGNFDGVLMANAAVKGMGWSSYIVRKLNPNSFTPAIGQGADAIISTSDFGYGNRLYSLLNHPATEIALLAERKFDKELSAAVDGPVFGLATVFASSVELHGGWISADGLEVVRHSVSGEADQAEKMGEQLAHQLLRR